MVCDDKMHLKTSRGAISASAESEAKDRGERRSVGPTAST